MNAEKEKSLYNTYQNFIRMCIYDQPLDNMGEYVADNFMGYGTCIDEKCLSMTALREMLIRQREQAKGIKMDFEETPVLRKTTGDGDSVFFVDEFKATFYADGNKHQLFFRLTTLFEYINNKWVVVHTHSSIPKENQAREDIRPAVEGETKNEELKKIVEQKTSELRKLSEELKATQSQLMQSEKMASLGELTAGIAHEIQNPLNFVNNFSEVNTELIDELQNELKAGNTEEAFSIANDIKENEQKINVHGKRADAIVQGMLQHSRGGTGKKEPVDINALADEYFRLSYHGLRAKDKTFNAALQTDFDKSIGKINIISQDIGRVLLNLFTNAFYSVTEKNKLQPENYEPTVSVSTKKLGNKSDSYRIEIRVKDNGMGIPQKVLDKIYEPFFTTKPTGRGTGLGLSLSYDIIKAHGGEIKVATKEGESTEFIILL